MFRTRHKRVAHASIAFDGIVTWSIFFLRKVSHRSSSRFFFWPRHTIPFLLNSPFNVTLSGPLHNLHFRRCSINLSSPTKNYIYMRCPGTRFKDVFRMSMHFPPLSSQLLRPRYTDPQNMKSYQIRWEVCTDVVSLRSDEPSTTRITIRGKTDDLEAAARCTAKLLRRSKHSRVTPQVCL